MRAILTYHAIDDSGSVISITRGVFRSHLEGLARASVAVVGIAELLDLSDHADAVAITFDDALESMATEAAPLLAEAGFSATVFVVSEHVGGDNRWGGAADGVAPVQAVLGWEALGRLGDSGWSIGSHSRRHPHLVGCGDDQLHDELEGSAETIRSRLGQRPSVFAYPYGDTDLRVTRAVAGCYAHACNTRHRAISGSPSPHMIPRLDAWYFRGPEPFREWGSVRFRRSLTVRDTLRRLKQALR